MLNIGAYINLQTSPRADAGGVGPITNYNMLHFAIQQMLQQDPTRTLLGFREGLFFWVFFFLLLFLLRLPRKHYIPYI